MRTLELFAGTRSIGKAFEAKGHEVFSIEWNKEFENIDLYADINTITARDILEKFGKPDVIWASPDCSTFSIAAISHHRRKNEITGNLDPVSDYAKFCDEVDKHVLELIKELNPTFYFIENPRGGMRKMEWMQGIPRYTVTYCQYELDKPPNERRMKPTDIWTNHPNPEFKPMCKNGDPCHAKAPRGSKTGTQGLKGSKERSVIPEALCQHIVDICEKYINQEKENKMELKVKTPTFPEVIEFNFLELKQEIEERTKSYANLVYAEDQMKQAKTDVANLRKFTKALSGERIKIKKECMKPYEDFESKIKELDGIVNKAISNIDSQIKAAEEQKKAEKKEKILELFKNTVFPDWVKFEQIFDARWLNASVSMASITKELIARSTQIADDIITLSNLPEFGFEAGEVYKTTLDVNRALNEVKRMSDIQKRKAEAERIAAERKAEAERMKAEAEAAKQQEEQLPGQISFTDAENFEKNCIVPTTKEKPFEECMNPPVEEREWVGFKAYLTEREAVELADFFKARGIQYEAINI